MSLWRIRLPEFALHNTFMGTPRESKKSAIVLCEWAAKANNPAKALLA